MPLPMFCSRCNATTPHHQLEDAGWVCQNERGDYPPPAHIMEQIRRELAEEERLLFNKDIGIWRDRERNKYDRSKCAAIIAPLAHAYSDWQCELKPGHGAHGLFCKRHAKKYPTNEIEGGSE